MVRLGGGGCQPEHQSYAAGASKKDYVLERCAAVMFSCMLLVSCILLLSCMLLLCMRPFVVRDSGSCILSESKKALHDRPCGGIAVVSFWILEHQCIGAEKLLQMGFPLHRLNIGNNTERDARLAIVWCILLPEFAIIVFGDDISGVAFAGGQLHAPAGHCRGHCSGNDRILARCFSMHSCQPWVHYTVAGCGPSNTSDVAALHMRSFKRRTRLLSGDVCLRVPQCPCSALCAWQSVVPATFLRIAHWHR